jgi:hypothetical protein
MTMLNLETAYPAHISQIDENRRVEINFDPQARGAPFHVCTFEPGCAERRKGCWTLREGVDLADRELERIRADRAPSDAAAGPRP